jgi:DNA-binding NarL/FixJ family response regulator
MTNIFIISRHLLFSHGLESLLCQEPDFKIIGQEAEIDQAISQIKKLQPMQPNVVIIYQDNLAGSSTSAILSILESLPQIKVVGLNVHDNQLYVYKATHYVANKVEDFVEAVAV